MEIFDTLPLTEVAALNTPEALSYFWTHVDVDGYYGGGRTRIFEDVVGYLRSLGLPDTGTLVDVGCGVGEFFRYVVRAFPYWTLFGTDTAAGAIEVARKRVPFAVFSVDPYPVPVDVVTALEVVEHQDDWRGMLVGLRTMVKPGGHLIVTIPNGAIDSWHGHKHRWTLDEARGQWDATTVQYIKGGDNILAHWRKDR